MKSLHPDEQPDDLELRWYNDIDECQQVLTDFLAPRWSAIPRHVLGHIIEATAQASRKMSRYTLANAYRFGLASRMDEALSRRIAYLTLQNPKLRAQDMYFSSRDAEVRLLWAMRQELEKVSRAADARVDLHREANTIYARARYLVPDTKQQLSDIPAISAQELPFLEERSRVMLATQPHFGPTDIDNFLQLTNPLRVWHDACASERVQPPVCKLIEALLHLLLPAKARWDVSAVTKELDDRHAASDGQLVNDAPAKFKHPVLLALVPRSYK